MNDLMRLGWVIPERLALSGHLGACDREQLDSFGIRSVLSLSYFADRPDAQTFGLKEVQLVSLIDGTNVQSIFDVAVREAQRMLGEHGTLLIHCREGRSRSTAVAAALLRRLHKDQGMSVDEAVALIKTARPAAKIYVDLMANLEAFQP